MKPRTTVFLTIGSAVAVHFVVSLCAASSSKSEAHPTTSVAPVPVVTTIEIPAKTDTSQLIAPKPPHHARVPQARQLDVAFCIDTTGSMGSEIETAKDRVKAMVRELKEKQPNARVRVGLVAYRDTEDDYVTKVYPLSQDVDTFAENISALNAEGGGDAEEAVDAGLHDAIYRLNWNKNAAKLVFLIGDAGPHARAKATINGDILAAQQHNIQINAIGCNGLENTDGQAVFKRIAMATNGAYEDLTYRQEFADASGKSHTIVTAAGKHYVVRDSKGADWNTGASKLIASGGAVALQGATNGTIGPDSVDATVITGVNTAGTVRTENNLGSLIYTGALNALNRR